MWTDIRRPWTVTSALPSNKMIWSRSSLRSCLLFRAEQNVATVTRTPAQGILEENKMPSYKLSYFNNRGKAEPTRMAFHLAGVEFEDYRFLSDDDWPQLKPKTPQGQCPILEIDGKMVPQSNSILRYVAREFDLYGNGNMENTEVDVVLDTVESLFLSTSPIYRTPDGPEKQKLIKNLRENDCPHYTKIFSAVLDNNNSGWLVGSKVTVADLALFNIWEFIQALIEPQKPDVENDILKNNEKLLAHRHKVNVIPAIKSYLASRPVTPL